MGQPRRKNDRRNKAGTFKEGLPDKAKEWRPPAATVVILTPGPRVTRQGDGVNVSSPSVTLSFSCLADDTFLRFTVSSTTFLSFSWLNVPLFVLEGWDLGLAMEENKIQVKIEAHHSNGSMIINYSIKPPCSLNKELCLVRASFWKLPTKAKSEMSLLEGTHSFQPHVYISPGSAIWNVNRWRGHNSQSIDN